MPIDLDEDVQVSEYRGEWARSFAEERSRSPDRLGLDTANFERIGSTAVTGMSAKPIVDIMIGFATFPPPQLVIEKITDQSYEFLGEAGVPGRRVVRAFHTRQSPAIQASDETWAGHGGRQAE
jgi:GrpB-like predicted nucleotidyltransferase (UPF0157 family)